MKVVLRLKHLDTYISTLVWSCIDKGIDVIIQAPAIPDHPWFDHQISMNQYILPCRINLYSYSPTPADVFIFQLTHSQGVNEEEIANIQQSAKLATKTLALYDAQYGNHMQLLKQQLTLLVKYSEITSSLKKIKYYAGWTPLDLLSFYSCSRSIVSIGPNLPIYDSDYRSGLTSFWDPYAIRTGKICFLGFLNDERKYLLDEICMNDPTIPAPIIFNPISLKEAISNHGRFIVGGGLSFADYPLALTHQDFSLCLPGAYAWSHRPFEAALRGSIPILSKSELPYFGGLFEPRKNCLCVSNPNNPAHWASAIRQALRMPDNKVTQMRLRLFHAIEKARYDLSGYIIAGAGLSY